MQAGVEVPPAVAAETPALKDEEIPVPARRRVIAQRLSESMFTAPHYYLTVSVRMDGLLDARRRLNESSPAGPKVSLNAFLIKLAARAIARHPAVNSTWQGDTIRRHGRVDIGLAVALDDGLVAPVVRDAAAKGVLGIEAELADLIARAAPAG